MKKYIRIKCRIKTWRHDVEGRPLTNLFDEIEAIMMHYKLAMQYFLQHKQYKQTNCFQINTLEI